MAVRVSTASDTFWHLRAGDWILEQGQILREDPFSITRSGEEWKYPGWLAQVGLTSAYRLLGFPGLNIVTTLFVVLGLGFTSMAMTGKDSVRVSVLLLAAIVSAVYWSARPHIITFALTGFFLWVLETHRSGQKNLIWTLPIAMILWANVHGGFASGFILIFCYLIAELLEVLISSMRASLTLWEAFSIRRNPVFTYIGIGLICALSLSVNPHGPVMILYPFKTIGIEALQDYIQEWQSPDFHDPQLYPFIASILLLLLAVGSTRKRVDAYDYVLSGVFLILALTAARNIALYALVIAPILSKHLSSGLEPMLERVKSREQFDPSLARRLNLTLLVLCALAAGLKIRIPLDPEVNNEELRKIYPYRAVEFIRESKPAGPMFNSYNWGAFILWELYPDYRTFVDGRTDLFNDEVLEAYLSAWRGEPEWREVFDRWDIQMAFIETDAPLRYQLQLSGWETMYDDDQAVIMVP